MAYDKLVDSVELDGLFTNIADAIRAKSGSASQYSPEDMPNAIFQIETGVDTSDANATANNIENGYSGYVAGEKIDGSLTSNSNYMALRASWAANSSTGRIAMVGKNIKKQILPIDGRIEIWTDLADFGNATAEDVVAGKTFTSAVGLKVTGTAVLNEDTPVNLQDKSVTPTTSAQSITADIGYDGLGTVTVDKIPSGYIVPDGILNITTNGQHSVRTYEQVVVDVPSSGLPSTITAGDTPIMASWAGQKVSDKTATETTLTLTMPKAGTYRFRVVAASSGTSYGMTSGSPTVALYQNGSAITNASGTINSNTVEALSFDVSCSANDVITVYGTAAGSTYSTTAVTCMALIACINWDII